MTTPTPFHIMTKPVGAICNLNCTYCYYLEKEKFYPRSENFRMPDDVLETCIRQYIAAQPGSEVTFAWQGGEPTLLGLDFFHKVVALQKQYSGGSALRRRLWPCSPARTARNPLPPPAAMIHARA